MAPKSSAKAPADSAHHKKHKSLWIANHGTITLVGDTMQSLKKLNTVLGEVINLQEAVIYYAQHGKQVSERLVSDENFVLETHHRIKFRQDETTRIEAAIATSGASSISDEDAAAIKRINETRDDVFKIFASIYPDRILSSEATIQQPSTYLPEDAEGQQLLLTLGAKWKVGTPAGGQWSAEQLYNMLQEVSEVESEKEENARLEALLKVRDDKIVTYKSSVQKYQADLNSSRKELQDGKKGWKRVEDGLKAKIADLEDQLKTDKFAHVKENNELKIDLIDRRLGYDDRLKALSAELERRNTVFDDYEALSLETNADKSTIARLEQELNEAWILDTPEQLEIINIQRDHAREVDQLTKEVEQLKGNREQMMDKFEAFFIKALREVVGDGKTVVKWQLSDLEPLRRRFDSFTTFEKNLSPPGSFGEPGQRALFADDLDCDLNSDRPTTELGNLLLTCLDPKELQDLGTIELRQRLYWVDQHVVMRLRQPGSHKTVLDQIKLSCLIFFMSRMLDGSRGDGVNYAWASCIVTEIFCMFWIPTDLIMGHLQRDPAQCSFLEAAGLLRLHMLVRGLSSGSEAADAEIPDFDDPRFHKGIENKTDLCSLDMPQFLAKVRANEFAGQRRSDPFFVSENDGKKWVFAVGDSTGVALWHCQTHWDWSRFFIEPVKAKSLDVNEGVAEWMVKGASLTIKFPRAGLFERYVGVYDADGMRKLLFNQGEQYKMVVRQKQRVLEERGEELTQTEEHAAAAAAARKADVAGATGLSR